MKNFGIWILVFILIFGCLPSVPYESENASLFEKLNKLEIDSLRRMNIFYRDMNFIVMRYYINDSCDQIQILSKFSDDGKLRIKYQDLWINIDSVEYYFALNLVGISKERIKYNIEVMEKLKLDEISTSCDCKGLRIKKDHHTFYYLFDTTLNKDYNNDTTLKKLESNWWVEK